MRETSIPARPREPSMTLKPTLISGISMFTTLFCTVRRFGVIRKANQTPRKPNPAAKTALMMMLMRRVDGEYFIGSSVGAQKSVGEY